MVQTTKLIPAGFNYTRDVYDFKAGFILKNPPISVFIEKIIQKILTKSTNLQK